MPNSKKLKGRVYTPDYIVNSILDMANYIGDNIIEKHVIDNSCGDGAFLCKIVSRYCETALKNGISNKTLKNHLEKYIHGIEIDKEECEKCLKNLDSTAKNYGLKCSWDIICDDALTVKKYNEKMDFVLGNPPYVRVHNLNTEFDTAKSFSFAQEGMTDLYIVFYEIGLKMLNENGILGYITPSSFFNSLAGKSMRLHFTENKLIEKLVDLKHYQPFNATAYTAIVILNKQHKKDELAYYRFDGEKPYFVETLTLSDCFIAQKFYFSEKENLNLLKKVFFNTQHCNIEVKNGYATLCDSVFIGTFPFNSSYVIPVIKASKGEKKQIIYPYNKSGKPIDLKELQKDRLLWNYLSANKEKLLNRSLENKTVWYAFGRSQALRDTYKDKIAINTLLRTADDLKLISAPSGTGVYSGLYLIGTQEELKRVPEVLNNEEFSVYISLLGKYKSGGYYTFSSKDVKAYLDYKLSGDTDYDDE